MASPREFVRQSARFSVVGIANTLVGAGGIFLMLAFGAGPYVSNIIGYAVGTLFSFVANSLWTFQSPMSGLNLRRFLFVLAAAYMLNLVVLDLMLRLGLGNGWSQVPAMICSTLANFVGQRYFTFRTRERSA